MRLRLWPFRRKAKAAALVGPPLLLCDYDHSRFEYFTMTKLQEIRAGVAKPYTGDRLGLLREISSAMNRKQTGGTL